MSAQLNDAVAPHKRGIPAWWVTIFLFWLGWIFMYADRTVLNPVMGELEKEFGLSGTQLGLMNSVFYFSYALLQVPAGILGDKIGKKKVLIPGFLLFGAFTAVTGWAKSWSTLLFARVVTGAGEGTYYGPQYGLSSEQIPKKYRSLGSAIINSGMAFGIALGLMASSWLVYDQGYSWRTPFFVMSIPTLLTGLAIWLFVKEKKRQPVEAGGVAKPKSKFTDLFKNRNLLLVYLMVFCSLFGFFVILTWLPYYLQSERGIAGSETGFITSLVAWISIPGALLFSSLSDRLGKRKPLILVLVPVAILSMLSIIWMPNMTGVIVALCVYGLVGKLALDPVLVALVADSVDENSYSSAFGLFNFIGMSSSILAPVIAGAARDMTGSLASSFYVSAALLVVGLVGMLFLKEKK
ncbi:MFS transporter [Raoultella ornithinolytica]|uniref:MFS transporter n=1 Tax=Raoultella ornithinolytica TaxID=54291 RepID=A0A855F9E4_RAOOR|nr:MFS transporter [Raoultella ornithinolytica]EKW1876446.1 MFS transporter [Raoultella ornithinolytica]ELK6034710.1 MFS transporter [Raoultella ornithinolytica]ELM7287095.1 MFS transporter [Raoultella ornithinolytica]ELO0973443.1 MFS transporter [Raoultella ornithinolytica]ELS5402345.1 MFS transporter [Raoultella ornithinolytica]